MSYVPELKNEIVDAVNKSNNSSIKPEDITIGHPTEAGVDVTVDLRPSGDELYGKRKISYQRREIDKFFLGIPVKVIVDKLGKTFTAREVINALNNQYGSTLFDLADFLDEELNQAFSMGEEKSRGKEFQLKETSGSWVGSLKLSLFQKLINLGYIVDKNVVTLDNPSPYTLQSYYADFTPYATMLQSAGREGNIDSNLAYLLNRGLGDIDVTGAEIVFNGVVSDSIHKFNDSYTNVMVLKPVGSTDDELVYIHYNYNPIPVGTIGTEGGDIVTDESGNILIVE